MYQLIAQIDSLDPRWDNEFKSMMEARQGEVRSWLQENCGVDHQTITDVYDDIIIAGSGFIITYHDMMCETVSLYNVL